MGKKFIILAVFLVIWLSAFFIWNMGSFKKKDKEIEKSVIVQDTLRHYKMEMPQKPDTHVSMRVDTAGVTRNEMFYCLNERSDTIVSLSIASVETQGTKLNDPLLQTLQNNLLASESLQLKDFVSSGNDTHLLRQFKKAGPVYFLYITSRNSKAAFLYREMNKDLNALKTSPWARSLSIRN